jgi:hypothetical protein
MTNIVWHRSFDPPTQNEHNAGVYNQLYFHALAGQRGRVLTVNRIVKSFEHISDHWIEIATELGLPYPVISSIQVSRLPNDQASLRKVVEWWFQNTANPEWSTIYQVLEGIVWGHACHRIILFSCLYIHLEG